ncbi:thioredoxin family protein [Bacteroidia bacterium]|jgi:peroxiredoxin|nr:thioredoxin family protein [Bacteroidota bacterium]MDA9110894.1 thioredoxin family protein [Bacteroidia bacterium]
MKKMIFGLVAIGVLVAMTSHSGYHVGDTATDFSLKGTDDQMHSLASIDGAKGYIVIFTCNHCPYSLAYEDRIIALQDKYGSEYPVVAINPNDPVAYPSDNFENMKLRAEEKGFNFLYLFDDGQKVYPQYGATKTPHVFLLDAQRTVKYIGAIDNSTKEDGVTKKYLEDAIEALKKGENPTPATTKAIGCSIKVAKG